jgi:hypothetical protein
MWAARQHTGVVPVGLAPGSFRRRGSARPWATREDDRVSTRTLLVLAAICGMAILAATAVQVMLAR